MPHCRWRDVLRWLSLWLLVVATPVLALDDTRTLSQYNCQTWRRENGLPANSVNAIEQTADGRLWLGASVGLLYFNGVDFRIANPPATNEPSPMAVTTLARRGFLGMWYGLKDGGIGFFDGKNFHPIPSQARPSWTTVHRIRPGAHDSCLVAADQTCGVLDTNHFDSLLPANMEDVLSICEDSRGRIWIGTADQGLYYWETGKLVLFPDPTLRDVIISSIAVEPSGKIWLGVAAATNGLRCYDADFRPLPVNESIPEAKALLLDRHGVLWIGTSGQGLGRCQNGTFSFFRKQDGLANDRILSLAETDDGSLWVGTMDGLTELSDVKFPILSAPEGLATEACLSVTPSPDGGIWAGTPDGVSFYRAGKFSSFGSGGADGFDSRWIKRVYAARNGDLYFIGAKKNLGLFSGGRVVAWWTNGIWPCGVTEDQTGVVAAFGGTLMRLEPGRLVPYRLADGRDVALDWINQLLTARDGSIWVASDKGVFQIKDGRVHGWTETNGLSNLKACYLCQDDAGGAVWAAQAGGIARYQNGVMRRISTAQGLCDNAVSAIVQDLSGSFWLDSSHGIFRVSGRELNAVADGTASRVSCTLYDGLDSVKTTDQLEEDDSACRSADGRIWFPSTKGIIVIDPAHLAVNSKPPPVFLDRVRVNGRPYATGSEPALEPGPGNLEFEYSALDYSAPQKIRYRYRLAGFDPDWVEAGSRRLAFYTNLKPGRYQFQVQACNRDGAWNLTGASLGLSLPSRFSETAGFRVICGLALVGFMFYLWWVWNLRRRELQLQKINQAMEGRVRERTAELATANATLVEEIEQRKLAQKKTDALQEQLMHASRLAGQAEVASSILHNVGNVLNSVNVSTTLLGHRLRRLRADNLAKAADLLEQSLAAPGSPDHRLLQLPAYLRQLNDRFGRECGGMLTELAGLDDNIEHIKNIVAFQQNYAKVSGVSEVVNLSGLVDGVLRVSATAYQRHAITVERDYQPVPDAVLDKHKVLQILINLFDNAKHACAASAQPAKKVTVRLRRRGDLHFTVTVADNGVGIDPGNLTRIFSYGFTTRKGGHGFGLHGSALAANQLGGTLTVASEGAERGATFVLDLPLNPLPAVPENGPADAASLER